MCRSGSACALLLRSRSVGNLFLLSSLLLLMSGCSVGYLVKSAYSQADLLRKRVPIEEAIKDPKTTPDQKRKLELVEEVRRFAENDLGLAKTKNYTSFVQLKAPYVTWVVQASERSELKHYLWRYPLVGSMPYRGYFEPEGAKEEAKSLREKGYDTYVRGVTAYSTLGWFRDPVLSSMLNYKDYDLVNTLIHETTHATVFIKSEADFNERLASFIGMKGTEAFYAQKEGVSGSTLKLMHADQVDEKLFGEWISGELSKLDAWYAERKGKPINEEERQARLKEIHARFASDLKPKLSDPDSFKGFEKAELNNARLMTYRLYFEDLSQFEAVFQKLGGGFKTMLEFARTLEKSKDPVGDLAKKAQES